MPAPLIVRLALDAQDALMAAADAVPAAFRDAGPPGHNSGAWLLVHAAETIQTWVVAYAGGAERDAWFDGYRDGPWEPPPFSEALAAAQRVAAAATAVLGALSEADVLAPARTRPGSRFAGWTVGQLIARSVAHLYVHAADLNALALLAGEPDLGLPGAMAHTRAAP